jgi:hypothetical protein
MSGIFRELPGLLRIAILGTVPVPAVDSFDFQRFGSRGIQEENCAVTAFPDFGRGA